MRALLPGSLFFVLLLSIAGCGERPATPAPDSGTPSEVDAGPLPDAGEVDAGADGGTDAGEEDAGVSFPETTITSGPSGASPLNSTEIFFISDDGAATFECSLDFVPFDACTSPVSLTALTDGTHSFSVRARDADGDVDPTPAKAMWTVDTIPPETSIDTGPTPTSPGSTATFTFSSNELDASFECSFDFGGFAACASPYEVTGPLGAAVHTFQVRAFDAAGNVDPSPSETTWGGTGAPVRVMAANITSGNGQSYDPGHGIRIFQGLKPDVVLIQEFNYGSNSEADLRSFVDTAFGASFEYARETGAQIPNGVISRFPILSSGVWDDPEVGNREFVWAQIDVPGPKDLWAVSLHLLTANASTRDIEAQALVGFITSSIPAGDYLVLGGDFNTATRGEPCIGTLSQVVETSPLVAPYPIDQDGNDSTNANRNKPYDWVLADPDLNPLERAVEIGSNSFPSGLVFDSGVYTPLSEVPPVLASDSDASGMQHMAVVKDFLIPL